MNLWRWKRWKIEKILVQKTKVSFYYKNAVQQFHNLSSCSSGDFQIFRFCIKNFTFFIFFHSVLMASNFFQPEKARLERKTSVKKSFFMSQSYDKIVFAQNLSGFKKLRKCEGSRYLFFLLNLFNEPFHFYNEDDEIFSPCHTWIHARGIVKWCGNLNFIT